MGVHKQVVEERRNGKSKTVGVRERPPQKPFLSFNPTREEKAAIKDAKEPLEVILDYMSTYVMEGYTLTLKFMTTEECYSLILRETSTDWQTARALSCWHSDWQRCYQMMSHALTNRLKGWPDLKDTVLGPEIDW